MSSKSTPDLSVLTRETKAFVDKIDELYGFYLDSTLGFLRNHEFMVQSQLLDAAKAEAGDIDQDLSSLYFGKESPTDPNNQVLHSTTQGEFKRRNGYKGKNHALLAQLLLVMLYEYWDTEYRYRIAKALGFQRADQLKIPLFGDLRRLRNDILHRQGIASPETVSKLEIIKAITPNKPIIPTAGNVDRLIRALKFCLDTLITDAGGADPRYRLLRRAR